QQWITRGRFFDPVRSPYRTGDASEGIEDGSGVLKRLSDWQSNHARATTFDVFRDHLLAQLNRLFTPRFRSLELKSQPLHDLSLKCEAEGATPIQLQSMGSGIAEMVIILASLEEDRATGRSDAHYHLEEPECHLHPKLLRRFMGLLPEYSDAQFFITSHSN